MVIGKLASNLTLATLGKSSPAAHFGVTAIGGGLGSKERQGAANPSYKFVANNVPPTIRRAWLSNSMDVTDKNEAAFRKSYEKLLGLVKLMHTAGVPL